MADARLLLTSFPLACLSPEQALVMRMPASSVPPRANPVDDGASRFGAVLLRSPFLCWRLLRTALFRYPMRKEAMPAVENFLLRSTF